MNVHHHLHLVSDATGETIGALARACLVQFDEVPVTEHMWSLVRNERQLQTVLDGIAAKPGLVLYTFVDETLRMALEDFCRARDNPCVAVLRPVLQGMTAAFGRSPGHRPGRQHMLDADYFRRIDAMDFAMAQDDGHGADRLAEADVVILGVSRTSKTPTCLYLAGRGVRAANIPTIPGHVPPPELLDLAERGKPMLVGLTKDADSLIAIRRHRLPHLTGRAPQGDAAYVDPERVRAELLEARRLFARLGCPVIDVSRRSIEETAAEIMTLLAKREKDRG